jgi:hypothetical protein
VVEKLISKEPLDSNKERYDSVTTSSFQPMPLSCTLFFCKSKLFKMLEESYSLL